MNFNPDLLLSPTIGGLDLMHRAIDEGRSALQELRSAASVSPRLEESLYGLWSELAPDGVEFRILVEGRSRALNPTVQEQIHLIVREALHNASRHSGATAIEAEVEYSARRLRVIVRDNGRGIDPQIARLQRDSHWGLQGMLERAGSLGAQLRMWSKLGAGTEVEVSIPIHTSINALPQFSTAKINLDAEPHCQDAWPSLM